MSANKEVRPVPPFKQIAVGTTGLGDEFRDWVYGLDDEGRVWMYDHSDNTWSKLTTTIFTRKIEKVK